jgi:RimJ/RimL family protein N-acetyltransferase
MDMPTLHGERVDVRRFAMDDLAAIHRILDVELDGLAGAEPLAARRRWLEWSVLNYDALASLHQPPYGDRAVVLRETGELIGACGLAPVLLPFDQLPSRGGAGPVPGLNSSEIGLYWAIAPDRQRRGYAAEAGQLLIDYAFNGLRLARIVATTEYDNLASQRVMLKLGMALERNPHAEPPWMQIVASLENPARATANPGQ